MCVSGAMDPTLASLIGVVIGAAATIIANIITAKGEMRRSREERKEIREQEERATQRNECIEIQDALWSQIRAIGLMWLEDQKDYQSTGQWNPKHRLSDNVDELELESGKRLVIHIQRIKNDKLREELERARRVMSEKVVFSSQQEERLYVNKYLNAFDKAFNAIGTYIRELS